MFNFVLFHTRMYNWQNSSIFTFPFPFWLVADDDDADGDSYLTGALALPMFSIQVHFTFQLRTARGALKKDSSVGKLPSMSHTRFSHHHHRHNCCQHQQNHYRRHMIRRASTAAELLVPNYGVPSRVTIIYGGRGDDDDEEEEGGDDDDV